MNMVGAPPWSFGSAMRALPTQEKAFTSWAAGDVPLQPLQQRLVGAGEERRTPATGGASAIGLVVSMTTLPSSASAQAPATASAAVPFTASTTSAPNWAACSKVPTLARLPAAWRQAVSLAGSRVPRMTSWPRRRKASASTRPTSPEPSTPTYMTGLRAPPRRDAEASARRGHRPADLPAPRPGRAWPAPGRAGRGRCVGGAPEATRAAPAAPPAGRRCRRAPGARRGAPAPPPARPR